MPTESFSVLADTDVVKCQCNPVRQFFRMSNQSKVTAGLKIVIDINHSVVKRLQSIEIHAQVGVHDYTDVGPATNGIFFLDAVAETLDSSTSATQCIIMISFLIC